MEARSSSPSSTRSAPWWWLFDPARSLRARAALLVVAGALGVTFLLSWITGELYQRSIQRQAASAFETLAFQVSDKIDRVIYERYRTLQLAASLTPIRDASTGDAARRNVLDALLETSSEFAWVGLTDAAGRVVLGTNRLFEGLAVETRPWFRNGRELPFVGPLRDIAELAREMPPTSDGERSTRFLDVAVPVTGANGQFAGVLAAHVRWNWAHDIQTSVLPEAALRDRIGVTVYGASRDVILDSGSLGWNQPLDAPQLGESRRVRGSLVEDTTAGTRYLTGFARSRGFREYRGIGWLTVVRQPVERVFADVERLRRSIVLWGTLLALVAGTISWIMAGRHARRLRSVRAAAERIHEGDVLAVLPRPRGESEVSAMCGALGELVEDLRAKHESVRAENARLTARLRENETAKQE
jgi:HAMP domain-containing protein